MGFYADLHVHSKYSRATSRDCDLEHMAYWARKKGVSVVGTGDFTHPAWFGEIEAKLVPAEPGLFKLRPDVQAEVDRWLAGPPVRFLLEVEISTIYKKDERTRKVHHLIYAPDLDKARAITSQLARIGNIASDGRPILGLDSRDLLEITLEGGEGCYLIPAHIWTPWFAALGSKSGFDSIEHCYGDLTPEIFALETGLSSDPPMNWRLSQLDRYTMVSNSDAHSPPKIGREACVFETEMDYFAMRDALKTGEGYSGTVEFFAEEGKYHLDGHRKCGVCLTPEESREAGGLCPACGKALTLGVMHRVCELADRDDPAPPVRAAPFRSLIPLEEVLSEVEGVGPKSKAVQRRYEQLVSRLGSELFVLESAPIDAIERAESSLVAEGLQRMREGRVIREPGYDGEYGKIRLFEEGELGRRRSGARQVDLFQAGGADAPGGKRRRGGGRRRAPGPPAEDRGPLAPPESEATKTGASAEAAPAASAPAASAPTAPASEAASALASETVSETASAGDCASSILDGLDPEQRSAARITEGPLVIVAGPGTGKTRTLTHRLAHLVLDHGVRPEECLAITFTNRAAAEMAERLEKLLGDHTGRPPVMTFHRLGLAVLQEHGARLGLDVPVRVASDADTRALIEDALSARGRQADRLLRRLSRARRDEERSARDGTDDELERALAIYRDELRRRGWVDFDDLIALPVELLRSSPDLVDEYRARYRWISVDEFQDVDRRQYELVKLLTPPGGNLCVIGDPDQSIYGFRGADVRCFHAVAEDFPAARTITLTRNYRSTRTIVDASLQMMAPASLVADRKLVAPAAGPERIEIHESATDRAEAEFVVHTIERMVGGSTFFSMDSGRVESYEGEALSFGDFAILYRTEATADALVEALARSGIPYQKRSHRSLGQVPAVEALVRELASQPRDGRRVVDVLGDAAATVRETDGEIDLFLPRLRQIVELHPEDLDGFLSEIALASDADLWDPRAEGVSLLTVHAAKGLEFRVVFIVGCEDGLLPLRFGGAIDDSEGEERRLFFVGMTRAEETLVLSHARRRARRGRVREMARSPFLADIEERLVELSRREGSGRRRAEFRQTTLF